MQKTNAPIKDAFLPQGF